jgi:hypothetical protein
VNTESVRIPNKTAAALAFDFSNDKSTVATIKDEAIEALVTNGVNALR